jgi:hypothetical protein
MLLRPPLLHNHVVHASMDETVAELVASILEGCVIHSQVRKSAQQTTFAASGAVW